MTGDAEVVVSSIRMEVQYQMLGHAAGVAAALAVAGEGTVHGVDAHRIDVSRLQELLVADGQVLAV
jgi:hypothetical protein